MTQSYQLYRTNTLLGGQMKYDLIVDENCTVNNIHITPVVDNVTPYNRYVEDNLLNYTNQENIKKFYTQTQGNFYRTYVDTTISGDYPIIPNPSRADGTTKNYDDSTFMGCSRMEYGLYKKQFQLFLPVWLETEFDDISFEVNICTPRGVNLVTKRVVLGDRVKKYFRNYFDFIGMDDKIMKVEFGGDCTVHGLDVSTGTMVTYKDFNLVNNITSRERPSIEFNSMIINTLKNKTVIAKQLFNFNLCFNIDDIVQGFLGNLDFIEFNVTGKIHLEKDGTDEVLPIKDFLTNFDVLPRSGVTIIDGSSISADNKAPLKTDITFGTNKLNIFDYKKDNTNIDIININKVDQKYVHWSLCGNNEYIFNLYDGWAGSYPSGIDLENSHYSHTYKSAPDISFSKSVQGANTIYWCNCIQMLSSDIGRISVQSILDASTEYKDNYINFIKYGYSPSDKYYSVLVQTGGVDPFDSFDNMFNEYVEGELRENYVYYKGWLRTNSDDTSKYLKLYLIVDRRNSQGTKVYFVFASPTGNLLNQANIKNSLEYMVSNKTTRSSVYYKYIKEYLKILDSIIQPSIVIFHKSIVPVKCPGPIETTDETTYYKIDDNYTQHLFRYDGFIKPTFIDSDSTEYNLIYYKDVVDSEEYKQKYDIYKKYINGKYPPKFPSIGYYPLTSEKLDYKLQSDEIINLTNNLCDIKWFGSSLVISLPVKINLNVLNDGSKSTIDVFREHMLNFVKKFNKSASDSNIEYISNLYKIQSDIELIDVEKYLYRISATLK